MQRLIDMPGQPLVGTAEASRMIGCPISTARKMLQVYQLECRPPKPGEVAGSCKRVYLRREVEMLAALRKKHNGRIPWVPADPITHQSA